MAVDKIAVDEQGPNHFHHAAIPSTIHVIIQCKSSLHFMNVMPHLYRSLQPEIITDAALIGLYVYMYKTNTKGQGWGVLQ